MIIRKTDATENGRRIIRYFDLSVPERPHALGGYSYPWPPRDGQVDPVMDRRRVVMKSEERARCAIHGGRDRTTVNGVCLPCALKSGYRPH